MGIARSLIFKQKDYKVYMHARIIAYAAYKKKLKDKGKSDLKDKLKNPWHRCPDIPLTTKHVSVE